MFIKLINVDVETATGNNNKTYERAEVLYDLNGRKMTHKLMSFVNPVVFKTIKDANRGDTFEVNVIKNPQGYNQWNSITKRDSPAEGDTPVETASPKTSQAAGVGRSFETAEEREARQRLIVRQSSLTAALATLTPGAKAALDPVVVQQLASQYVDWVFEKVDIFDEPNDL